MQVIGNYHKDGYAHLRGLFLPEVTQAFLQGLKTDIGPGAIPLSRIQQHPNLLARPAFEIYGHHYKPMLYFLWGLTPIVSNLVGAELLPTYDYFRVYRGGDLCHVHHDRHSCEHSLSLTLAYSDDKVWELEIEKERSEPSARVEPNFGGAARAAIAMGTGDAVLYQGVNHRHGRTNPNPNGWSAHLFLHWVHKDGPYADHAFDKQLSPDKVGFSFV
jgi:hypothetical protein